MPRLLPSAVTVGAMQQAALTGARAYDRSNERNLGYRWTSADYVQGMLGDLGDLAKLVQVWEKKRQSDLLPEELRARIDHEVADLLWSTLVLADRLSVDLPRAFAELSGQLRDRANREDLP